MPQQEDEAHVSGQQGEPVLTVRSDTAASTTTTDGDYAIQISDSTGHTWTVDKNSAAGLTLLQSIDGLVLLEDAAHSNNDPGVMMFTVRKDTAAAFGGADGDYQPPITDANGHTWVRDKFSETIKDNVAEANLFGSSGKTIVDDLEFLALNNTQGTAEINANTGSSRFAFMGLQGATNTTGATVSIQDRTSGTVLIGPIPMIANTHITGFPITGFPYAISSDNVGLQIVVSGSARVDGVLQFVEIGI